MSQTLVPRSWSVFWVLLCGLPAAAAAGESPAGSDLVRSTVQIRNGEKRGSGTVVASVDGETWVLTAAHVVKGTAAPVVELHRHNLTGSPAMLTDGGGWPRLVKAKVAATDTAGDVALLRVEGVVSLPHVTRFDPAARPPVRDEVLTSVGIDRGLHLSRWQTSVVGTALIDIGQGGGAAPFTVVTRFPEHGRSGGGLCRADGSLVGVCTGQLSPGPGRPKVGVFASYERVRQLLVAQGVGVPSSTGGASRRGQVPRTPVP